MKGGQASSARSQMTQQKRTGMRETYIPFGRDTSQGTAVREAIQKGEMPDDAPLFPGTLIMPRFSVLWGQLKKRERVGLAKSRGKQGRIAKFLARIFRRRRKALGKTKDVRKRRDLSLWDRTVRLNWRVAQQILSKQYDRVKRHGQDFISLVYHWRYALGWPGLFNKEGWKKMRLSRHKMKTDAIAMYEEMYIALYSNNAAKLEDICCNRTSEQLAARCKAQLQQGVSYDWRLVRHLGWRGPQVMSHKATPQQIDDGSGFPMIYRQAVIRMYSRQQLTAKKQGVAIGELKEVDILEYLVLQKRFYMGKEGPWKIWGTVQEAASAKEWNEIMNPDPLIGSGAVQAIGST